jgi:hypothetical protein
MEYLIRYMVTFQATEPVRLGLEETTDFKFEGKSDSRVFERWEIGKRKSRSVIPSQCLEIPAESGRLSPPKAGDLCQELRPIFLAATRKPK